MVKIKGPSFIVILSVLLAACQANPVMVQTQGPGPSPDPSPVEVEAGQGTPYPAFQDAPVTQETANPYPGTGGEQATSDLAPAYAPKPEDEKLQKGMVFPNLQDSGILLQESFPVQVVLVLSGDLPTPCHQLRVKASSPDSENRIQVEAYTVVDPDMICTQVIKPFETQVALGSYESGKYTVYVNGEYLGEFTI
jgi:hypothetical protein